MNIDAFDVLSLQKGVLKQHFPKCTIRMIGALDTDFIGSPLYIELIYRDLIQRELGNHRGKPKIDKKFTDMLSALTIGALPSFEINSYFCFSKVFKTEKEYMSAEEIMSRIRANGYGQDFFTPEEAHQVAAHITQEDVFCKMDQPVLIFYRFVESSTIFCMWLRRNRRNQLQIWDLDYYVTTFEVPSSIIVFTKDNVFVDIPSTEEGVVSS